MEKVGKIPTVMSGMESRRKVEPHFLSSYPYFLTHPPSCFKVLLFTMHAVQWASILVTGQVIPLLQNVFQGYLKLPGQNGILVLHL